MVNTPEGFIRIIDVTNGQVYYYNANEGYVHYDANHNKQLLKFLPE